MCSDVKASDQPCEQDAPEKMRPPLDAHTYKALFEKMLNGVACYQVLFDDDEPRDFVFLYTNPTFHAQTGLGDVVGKSLTSVAPGIRLSETKIFQLYSRVAKTGTPEILEVFAESLKDWLAISVYSPQENHLVAVLDVITSRKVADQALAESENRFRHFASLTSDLIYSCRRSDDGLFRIDWLGGNASRVLGIGNHELKTMGCWRPLVVADDIPLFVKSITDLTPGQSSDATFRVRHRDGSVRHLRSYAVVEPDPDSQGQHRLYGALQDISEHKQSEAAIQKSEMFFKESQRAAFIGSYLLDFTTGLWESSEVLDQIFGIGKDYDRSVHGWLKLLHPDDVTFMNRHLQEDVIGKRQPFNHEYRVIRKSDGEVRWCIGRGEVSFDGEGNPLTLIGTIMDITERKTLEQRLERLAQTDFLTGLNNRGHFLEIAQVELARVRRYRTPMALAMLDLDHFKVVNDTYGHDVGDRVLKRFAETCRQALREIDVMGRIGGEEFAILFPETTTRQALEVSERLREAVAKTDIPTEQGQPIHITVSLGLASFVHSDVNIDVMLNRADRALYEAKHNGRNRTCEAIVTTT